MSKCDHDLAEKESFCADGACPFCMRDELLALREENERLKTSLTNSYVPQEVLLQNSSLRTAVKVLVEALEKIRKTQFVMRGSSPDLYNDPRDIAEKAIDSVKAIYPEQRGE